eukprot:1922494-Lingulodinium_polyedra.AAC.1
MSSVRSQSSDPTRHFSRSAGRRPCSPKGQARDRRGGGPPGLWRAADHVQHGGPACAAWIQPE